jgi:hypothetical protein
MELLRRFGRWRGRRRHRSATGGSCQRWLTVAPPTLRSIVTGTQLAAILIAVNLALAASAYAQSVRPASPQISQKPMQTMVTSAQPFCLKNALDVLGGETEMKSVPISPLNSLSRLSGGSREDCIDLSTLSCTEMEDIALVANYFCNSTYSELLCSLIANGCTLSDDGLKRFGEIIDPDASPKSLQGQVAELAKSCKGSSQAAQLGLSNQNTTQLRCDALFQGLEQADKGLSELTWTVRALWEQYFSRKCNRCAASLNGINVYDPCESHDPPPVQPECECKSDLSLPYACFNRLGNTCCKNESDCVLPVDETTKPRCISSAPKGPEVAIVVE